MLQYFEDMMGAGIGQLIKPVSGTKISIDGSGGFKANGTAYPRITALGDRDVQLGDRVYIRGVGSDSKNYELDTYVTGIEGDLVNAVVTQARGDTANGGPSTALATVTQNTVTPNTIHLSADNAGYSAMADGVLHEVYTITVIESSGGGDLTTAKLRITTSSGLDNVLSIAPAAAGDPFTVGHRGLSLTFDRTPPTGTDDLLAGQVFHVTVDDAYVKITADKGNSVYRGARSTTYVIDIVRGGFFNDPEVATQPLYRVTTVHGTDSSAAAPLYDPTVPYLVGTQGVEIKFGDAATSIRTGDRFYIDVAAAGAGRMSTLVLANNLPPLLLTPTPALDLTLILGVERDIMVDEVVGSVANWEQSETQLVINAGIEAYDEEFTSGGEPRAMPVTGGSVYVEYRAWLSDLTSTVGTISDVGDLDTAISGPLSPDNPLKWGVYKALSNSNGSEVKYTAVADPTDLDSWVKVLALLVGRDDVYNLVPLTFDREVLNLYAAHASDESSPEQARWRCLFGSIQAKSQKAVVSDASSTDEQVVLALISQNIDNQFTLLTVPNGNSGFLDNQVRPSDVVRTNYGIDTSGSEIFDEFVIDEVINEDSLLLMSGPVAAITTAQKIEVWRHLSRDEIATDLAQQAGSFSSRRVKMVWPDTVGSGGVLMEGYYLAAALAGLRSGVVPHQGLTNVQVLGFDDLSRTTDFLGGAQLNTMAAAGTWIVTQAPDGTVYNRHALTTDNTDVNSSEEMITSNLDSISYLFSSRLAPYIGRMNVTPSALLVLGTEIDSTIDFLKSNGYVARLGGQLIDGTIISLQPHLLLKDRVVCVLDVTLPYPMNNLELHLVV